MHLNGFVFKQYLGFTQEAGYWCISLGAIYAAALHWALESPCRRRWCRLLFQGLSLVCVVCSWVLSAGRTDPLTWMKESVDLNRSITDYIWDWDRFVVGGIGILIGSVRLLDPSRWLALGPAEAEAEDNAAG